MTSEDKSKLLGILFWLFTVFNVLTVVVVAIFLFIYFGVITAFISQMPHKANDPPPEVIVGMVGTLFVVVMAMAIIMTVLFAVPKVIAGYGLRNHKPWARTWAIVASIICCLSIPLGTAIGIFGLVFLYSDEGKKYFEDTSSGRLSPAPNS
jgi:hypothetical protein